MKLKPKSAAPASEALLSFLTTGAYPHPDLDGAFETFQLAIPRNDYEALRPHWIVCRAWILAARRPGDPAPWGTRFDKGE